jgi:Cu/Ag efflux protein CusF
MRSAFTNQSGRGFATPLRLAALTLVVSLALMAHGDEEHIMGTVKLIKPGSITVTTTQGKTVEVLLDSHTTFTKADQPAALGDLKPGDRVVIHAKKSEGRLTASSVKFGAAKSAPQGAGHSDHGKP